MKRTVIFLSAFGLLLSVSYAFGADQKTTKGDLKQEATEQVISDTCPYCKEDVVEDKNAPAAKKKTAAEKAEIVCSNSAAGAHVDDPVVRDHRTTKADPVVRDHRNESPEDAAAQTNPHVQRIGGKLGETHPRDHVDRSYARDDHPVLQAGRTPTGHPQPLLSAGCSGRFLLGTSQRWRAGPVLRPGAPGA